MASDRYLNPPLRLVAAELRYPFAPRLGSPEVLEVLTETLRELFPIPEQAAVMFVAVGSGGPQAQAQPPVANRFLTRDRSTSLTVTPTNIVIETTQYPGYQEFRPILESSLAALGRYAHSIVGLERVGLRYVNEIRVPSLQSHADWIAFIDSRMVGPMEILGERRPALMQCVVQSEPKDNVSVILRFGGLRGQVVSSSPLRATSFPADAPFFLLDIDSFWASGEAFEQYDVKAALAICDQLHGPIEDLFERSITDRLRNEVLRRPA